MRTDISTQFPIEVTRVQGTSPASAVKRDEVRTVAIDGTGSHSPQKTIDEKVKGLEKELKSLNNEFKSDNVELKLSRDDKTGIVVMKFIDSNTGASLSQIPSEVSLKLAETFSKLGVRLINSEA